MKVLLFTHKIDIDGMGSAILSKLAFQNVNYVLCETFEINKEVSKYYDNGEIYSYDYIFVTDICIKEPLLSIINNDTKLKNKVYIFDHHITEIKENNNKYDWVNITVDNEIGKCCGTSLFYKYLLDNNYLNSSQAINEFVELTRRYDTWEWKEIYSDEKSNELNTLFNVLGNHSYINYLVRKLEKQDKFSFSDVELDLINNFKMKTLDKVNTFISNMVIKDIDGYKVGITFVEDEYRNDVALKLQDSKTDIDLVMMILLTRGTISYRCIKKEVDVGAFAMTFGGKGHKAASSSPILTETKEAVINIILDGKK